MMISVTAVTAMASHSGAIDLVRHRQLNVQDQRHRRHPGKVERQDGQREHRAGADIAPPHAGRCTRKEKAPGAEPDPQRERRADPGGSPRRCRPAPASPPCRCNASRRCPAPAIAPPKRRPKQPRPRRDAAAEPDDRDRAGHRQHRQAEIVAKRHARSIGQHRDEMRRPDAAAGNHRRPGQPQPAMRPRTRRRALRLIRLKAV